MGYEIVPLIPHGYKPAIVLTPDEYNTLLRKNDPISWPQAFTLLKGLSNVADLLMKDAQVKIVDVLERGIGDALGAGLGTAYVEAAAGPEGDADHLKSQIESIYLNLTALWKSGIWNGMGDTPASFLEQFMGLGQWVYAYKILAYNAAITPRMRRHWNRLFTPQVPDATMAWKLYLRGVIKWDQFKTYAAYDGWNATGAEQLKEVWEENPTVAQAITMFWRNIIDDTKLDMYIRINGWPEGWTSKLLAMTTRLPSPQEAWYMWNRGLITPDRRNEVYRAYGYSAEWYEKLNVNFSYAPTVYDLMRLADYVELDQIWTLKKMAQRGVIEEDRAKIWEALQLRPLADERKALTAKWTWRRKMGRATEDQLSNEFIGLGIRTKERELLIEKANLDYEDELIDEWVEILIWRFRTAVITEEEFLQGLIELGINTEKSNLIVELEKAKGYYGYY